MKSIINRILVFIIMLFAGYATTAQTTTASNNSTTNKSTMKTYLIERDIPGAGKFTSEQLKGISQKSCSVLKEMGPQI